MSEDKEINTALKENMDIKAAMSEDKHINTSILSEEILED